MADRSQPPATPPELVPVEPGRPVLRRPPGAAAGPKAVASSLAYTVREAGVVRGAQVLLRVNQEGGFDCPSCAWPDPGHRSVVEFCENGARAVADEATRRRVTPEFFARHSVAELAARDDRWLNRQGRLTHPMILRPGATHYEPLSWDDAIGTLAGALQEMADPNRAIFYTSGRTANETAFLYQLFARSLGTNNLPDCSNMCHESSGAGLGQVIGIGKGTVLLEDFERADAIFVIGQNPGTNHPRMLSALQAAKRRGARIVTINPLREAALLRFRHPQRPSDWVGPGTEISDLYLQVRIGGDQALLMAIMKAMLEQERRVPGTVLDHEFIHDHTDGFEALEQQLDATEWRTLLEACGVPEDQIRAAARVAMESKATIACWAMGITQHENGVANVQSVVNFLMLRGNLGRPGAGVCPVRGHSNVQGDRTMGIWEKAPPWIDRLEARFGVELPRQTGHDVVGAIEAMAAGEVDVFVAMGGNFLSASPDTVATADALRRCKLTAQVSTKLNRSHLVTGGQALILPCLGRTERDARGRRLQFVTVENSMGIVHPSRGTLEPASAHLLPEPVIVARLARATLGPEHPVPWEDLAADYDQIRDAIAEVVPGFEDLNRRVREAGGFALANPVRAREFRTATGKARFTVHPLPARRLRPGEFVMATVRTHDQFNTTIYDGDDRYRGIHGHRRVVLMSPADMGAWGLSEGDEVDLVSHFQGERRRAERWAVVPQELPPGCLVTYFPEANVLVPLGSYAQTSRTPTSKYVVVTLHPRA